MSTQKTARPTRKRPKMSKAEASKKRRECFKLYKEATRLARLAGILPPDYGQKN